MRKPDWSAHGITQGNLWIAILLYSIPIMIGSLIQTLFNAADLVVLGNFAPLSAVSSVGLTSPIVSLVVGSALGLSGGTNAVMARYIGAKNTEQVRRTVGTSLWSALFVGVLLSAVAIPLCGTLLNLIRCPSGNFEEARLYLVIYFAAIPAILVYNFGAAILRADGDSTRPLVYLILCGLLNVVLNIVLCFILQEKVAAVAIATFASQVLGAVLVVVRLCRVRDDCRLCRESIRFYWRSFGTIMRFGLPCALTGSLYSVSNLQVQAAFNGFGDSVIAGNTAAASVESFVDGITNAFGISALVFVGQNFGSGNHERVKKSTRICLTYSITLGLALGFGVFALGRPILSVFLPGSDAATAEAIEAGLLRMKFLETTYFIISVYYIFTKIMQAFGYSTVPALLMVLTILGFRVVYLTVVFPLHPTLIVLYLCYPASWLLTLLVQGAMFLYVWKRYRTGKLHVS